mgnify:CR=1 FL=1
MHVSVVGSGYIGTTIAAWFAELGHTVTNVDIDEDVVAAVNDGEAPIHEPGLDELMAAHGGDALVATTDYDEIADSDVTFLALPTPSKPDGSIDLSAMKAAARSLGEVLAEKDDDHLVVVNVQMTDDVDHIRAGKAALEVFEERFAEWNGSEHAITCNSGTSALHVALAAVGVGWAGRSRAATRVGQRLDPAVDRLEAGALPDGRAVSVGRNEWVAETWATARCPGGPNRQFGSCEAVDGLVFQARGGEATLVAVAFDVRVTDPQGTRRAGIVVRGP